MNAAHAQRKPRNLTQLMARDAQVDSVFMAEICRIGSELFGAVADEAAAAQHSGVRPEQGELS